MKNSVESLIVALVIPLLVFLSAIGCTRKVYQPVQIEKVKTDSIIVSNDTTLYNFQSILQELKQSVSVHDSIIVRDSIIVVINDIGEVVSKEAFHDRNRAVIKSESLIQLQNKYDSIIKAQRQEFMSSISRLEQLPIKKSLSAWDTFKQDVGGVAIGILLAVIIIIWFWIVRKFKRK